MFTEQQHKEFFKFYELIKKITGKDKVDFNEVRNNPILKKAFDDMKCRLYPRFTANKWANVKIKDVPPEGERELMEAYKEDDPIGFQKDLEEFDALPKLEKEALLDGNAWNLMNDVTEFKRITKVTKSATQEFMNTLSPKEWETFKKGAKWAMKNVVKSVKYSKKHYQEIDRLRKKLKVKEAIDTVANKYGFSPEGLKQQYYDKWFSSKK